MFQGPVFALPLTATVSGGEGDVQQCDEQTGDAAE
jgi:hypothetical protein